MNWGALKALAKVYVHRSDLDFDGLAPLVASNISTSLIVQENETTATVTTTGPNNGLFSAALPVDYGLMRSVTQNGHVLNPMDVRRLSDGRTGVTAWNAYAISGMLFYSLAGGDYSLVYTARTAPLVGDSATSVLLDRYPDVWLYGLLKHAAAVIQDPEVNSEFYEQQFLGAIKTANSLYVDAAFGPGTMARPMGGLA